MKFTKYMEFCFSFVLKYFQPNYRCVLYGWKSGIYLFLSKWPLFIKKIDNANMCCDSTFLIMQLSWFYSAALCGKLTWVRFPTNLDWCTTNAVNLTTETFNWWFTLAGASTWLWEVPPASFWRQDCLGLSVVSVERLPKIRKCLQLRMMDRIFQNLPWNQ